MKKEQNVPLAFTHQLDYDPLIRFPQVQEMLGGVSRSTVERLVAASKLPRPIRLGIRMVAWRRSAVLTYLDSLALASENVYQRKAVPIRGGVLQQRKAKVIVEDSILQMVRTRWPDDDDDIVMSRTNPVGYFKQGMRQAS